jgi:uncharacterized phiE125 gp8 family phage protein
MAADPADLTTVANLQAWLRLTNVSTDTAAELQRLVTAVSRWIQSKISRTIPSQAYTDTLDGQGGTRMILGNYPVAAVASVTIDGNLIPQSTGPAIPGWVLANDGVSLRGYVFTRDLANVVISYTAGYASVPDDLEQACLELASMRWKERDRIGHSSVNMAGQQTNFIVKDMPDSVRTILQQWNKVVPC